MKTVARRWLEQATYDMETAQAMFSTGRYLYVAFMCQQAIEKLLKAIIQEKTDAPAPFSHRLVALLEITGISGDERRLDFLDLLTRYYINARYPEHKQKLSSTLNRRRSEILLKKTKECFQWLKKESKM